MLELLERRIALLASLADTFMSARANLVSFDLGSLEARIADQERLCIDIHSIDARIDQIQRQCASQLAAVAPTNTSVIPAASPDHLRLRDTLARLQQVQARVKQLNNAHQILLRRSRRTVGALLNCYHSFATTYSNPSTTPSSLGERV